MDEKQLAKCVVYKIEDKEKAIFTNRDIQDRFFEVKL